MFTKIYLKNKFRTDLTLVMLFLCLTLLINTPVARANMIIRGQCFIDGAPAPDGLDIRFKINVSGVYKDYTILNKNHQTRNGFYEGEAMTDISTTFEKDGFIEDDVVFVFVNGQISKNSSLGASPLNFPFKDNTIQSTPNGYINNEEPEPATKFTGLPLPGGRIKLSWTSSPSEDVAGYNIYWDNNTGNIDYTTPWVVVSKDETSYTSPQLIDGALYYFHLKTVDTLGKIENNRINVTSVFPDNQPPLALVTSPTELEEVNGDFEVLGSASDPFFQKYKVEFGRSVSPVEWDETGPFSFVPITNARLHYFDSREVTDGIYTLKLTVYDYAGNISVAQRAFYLSQNPRNIIAPKSFEIISGSVNFTGTASDPLFTGYRLDFGRGEQPSAWSKITSSSTQVNSGLLGTWNTSGYDGLYSVRLVLEKSNGSETLADTIIVYIENSPPPISITEPDNFSITNTPVQVIKGMSKSNALLKINGTTIEIPSNTTSFEHTVTLMEGLNQYLLTASDRSGNTNQATFNITLDTVVPLLDINAPIDNLTSSTPSVTISGTTEPDATLSVNDIEIQIGSDGKFSHKINLSGNQNNLEFTAIDTAGNIKRESRVVIFTPPYQDILPPEISIITPKNLDLITNTKPDIKIGVSDDLSGLDESSVEFYIDDIAGSVFLQQDTQYLSYINHTPSSSLSEGTHQIKIKASDKSGNQSIMVTEFNVDSKKPECSISLEMDATNQGLLHIRVIPSETLAKTPVCSVWLFDADNDLKETDPYYMIDFVALPDTQTVVGHYYGTLSPGSTINGKIVAKVVCQDIAGSTLETSASMASLWADPGTSLLLEAPNTASLLIPGSSIKLRQRFTIDNENISAKQIATSQYNAMQNQGLTKVKPGVVINPEDIVLPADSTFSIIYDDKNMDNFLDIEGEIPVERLSIYSYNISTKEFEFMKSSLDSNNNLVKATVNKSGSYYLLADFMAPMISLLTSPEEKSSTNPKILYKISDSGSGIDSSGIVLKLNNLPIPFVYDESSGQVAFFPKTPLSSDTTYAVNLSVTDRSQNTAYKVISFTTMDVMEVTSCIPYPNPVRSSSVTIRYVLTRDANEVRIDIYDTTGDKVFEDTCDTYGGINEYQWNTLTTDGKTLPNDVYFFKITAWSDESKHKKSGKIMLLR